MSCDHSKDWEKIAKEYKAEIEYLWNDMLTVFYDLEEDISPRSIDAARELLGNSHESSEKVVREIEMFN